MSGQTFPDPGGKYKVLEILGEGSFGVAAKCCNRETNKDVVLKVLKTEDEQRQIAKETEMLDCVRKLDPDTCHLVRSFESFEYHGRYFMVFENLDKSVYTQCSMLKKNQCFSLSQIRPMTKQLLTDLLGLQIAGVLHTDIKPNNIMLVDQERQPFKVKLIDFGKSKHSHQVTTGQIIQDLTFRAPEVSLGLPLSEAVDMWSLGCCLAHWYLSRSIFKAFSPFDSLMKIVHFQGTPPENLLNKGLYTSKYFVQEESRWRLKTLQEYRDTTGKEPKVFSSPETEAQSLMSLIMNYREYESNSEYEDIRSFNDLLNQMFKLDPEKRIMPLQALLHPFITMDHLPSGERYTSNAHKLMRCVAEEETALLQPEGLLDLVKVERKHEGKSAKVSTKTEETLSSFDEYSKDRCSPGEVLDLQTEEAAGHLSGDEHTNTGSYMTSVWFDYEEDLQSLSTMAGKSDTASAMERPSTSIITWRTMSEVDEIEQVEGDSDQEASAVLDSVKKDLHMSGRKTIKRNVTSKTRGAGTSRRPKGLSVTWLDVNETEDRDQEKSAVFDPVMEEMHMRCRKIIYRYLKKYQKAEQSEDFTEDEYNTTMMGKKVEKTKKRSHHYSTSKKDGKKEKRSHRKGHRDTKSHVRTKRRSRHASESKFTRLYKCDGHKRAPLSTTYSDGVDLIKDTCSAVGKNLLDHFRKKKTN